MTRIRTAWRVDKHRVYRPKSLFRMTSAEWLNLDFSGSPPGPDAGAFLRRTRARPASNRAAQGPKAVSFHSVFAMPAGMGRAQQLKAIAKRCTTQAPPTRRLPALRHP
jgi:hypothetical protein